MFTFHSYCLHLLHRNPHVRSGLSDTFSVYPKLPTLLKSDWAHLHPDINVPEFVKLMRRGVEDSLTLFYLSRSDYYDAVGFDDMVYRVYLRLTEAPQAADRFDLILVDEYQDFNYIEVTLLEILSRKSAIVIAGDDDQVLYGSWRESSWNFIRNLHAAAEFANFELPFCMRCPEVVINAFHDVVNEAVKQGLLLGRIPKTFRYYPPAKEADSIAHPKIRHLHTSIQKKAASTNYFGRVIAKAISGMPIADIKESRAGGYPTALVIGGGHYLDQIGPYLREQGFTIDEKTSDDAEQIQREDALRLLKNDENSRLGWRLVVEVDQPDAFVQNARTWLRDGALLGSVLPSDYRTSVLADAAKLEEPEPPQPASNPKAGATIKLCSFEGAKGLSAQYVFIVGLHNKDLPRNPSKIRDIEVCKFLVAMTRTRKECYLITTGHFGQKKMERSVFVDWIGKTWKEYLYVDKNFWASNP